MRDLLRKSCPYPTIGVDGCLVDGLWICQPKKCRKCAHQSCVSLLQSLPDRALTHAVCEEGYSVVSVPSDYGPLWANGVLVPLRNTAKDAAWRKANRSQKAPWEQLETYASSLSLATGAIRHELQAQAKEAVAGLHDIKTAVGVVLRNAEAIIRGLSGRNDYEKIENADPPLKSLLKSVNLLESRLKLASLIANPESAQYGERRLTGVYPLFHLMVRLFEQDASRRKVRLRMTGSSYNSLWLYDSFDTLPLVLIDNAIKYSPRHKDVVVRVEDRGSSQCVARVESWGPVVRPEDRVRIFERGFRGPGAENVAASGSGLGLYIAKIVAEANGCSLGYTATTRQHDDTEGTNIFAVEVQDAPTDDDA